MKICKFEEAIARLGKRYEFKKEYEMFEYEILMIKQKTKDKFWTCKSQKKMRDSKDKGGQEINRRS